MKREQARKLFAAVYDGRREEAQQFLGQGADADARNEDGTPLLFVAAMKGRNDIMRDLLGAGADVNLPASHGTTPLMIATQARLPQTLEILLDAGADVDRTDETGRTALWFTSDRENAQCEKLLREHGAKELKIEPREEEIARRKAEHAEATMNRLRKVRTKNRQQLAVYVWDAIAADLPQEASRLIQMGADVNFQEEEDSPTVLMWAAHKGYVHVLRVALDAGAKTGLWGILEMAGDIIGPSLVYAAAAGHLEALRMLLDAGADSEATGAFDQDGGTPLIIAAARGHSEVVRALLSAGANPNVQSRSRRTPLQIASQAGHEEVVRVIEEATKKA